MQTYDLMFTARIAVVEDALYAVTRQGFSAMAGPQEGNHIQTQAYEDMAHIGLKSFLYSSFGFRPARHGDVLRVTGTVSFKKRESGWVASDLLYRVVLDSSGRSTISQAGRSLEQVAERASPSLP